MSCVQFSHVLKLRPISGRTSDPLPLTHRAAAWLLVLGVVAFGFLPPIHGMVHDHGPVGVASADGHQPSCHSCCPHGHAPATPASDESGDDQDHDHDHDCPLCELLAAARVSFALTTLAPPAVTDASDGVVVVLAEPRVHVSCAPPRESAPRGPPIRA